MAACPSCGKENDVDARFCSRCGAALAKPASRELRKTVTVLFCDVSGSTALGERLDPEATRKLMTRYFEAARGILERHGGQVEKFIGDAVMAVFGVPRVHEDDALRATRAALELRNAVPELELRIGVNTGEVVAGAGVGETFVTGDSVNVAARLEQVANPEEILLGEQTYRLVREAVEVEPVDPILAKGKTEPVRAYRLVGVIEGAAPITRRLNAPLVAREAELAELEAAYARAVRERTCQLFTLLGVAGIGKSRLSHEFLARVGDQATIVRGHCLAYGEGITYWPLVEILRELGKPADVAGLLHVEPDARRIVNDVFAGVGLAAGVVRLEETNRAVRKLFEALAQDRPLIVLLDDLQWAEPVLLDLIEHVAVLSREAPILLLCLARPELLESRPGWSSGLRKAQTLLLEPLSDEHAEQLIANLLAGGQLGDDVRERISTTAEGNPLFLEQMLAVMSEDGATTDLHVPPTIQALLAARLDRLGPPERELLECASVVGSEFWLSAVVELGADEAALPTLVRKELIQPTRSTVVPSDDAYRFRHELIRDAAYEATPKEVRARMHERAAGWLERQFSEFDEIVGYHLEQAFHYGAQLGEPDEHAREVGDRAGRLLAAAGLRAADRADVPAAINLLTRAVVLLPADDERRLEVLAHLGYAHFDSGAMEKANVIFDEAAERATRAGLPILASRATVGRLAVSVMRGDDMSAALEGIEREIAKLEEVDDPVGLAEAYREAAKVESHHGRSERADRSFERAVANARRSRSRRIESDVLLWRLAMQCWGYLPAGVGVVTADEVLAQGVGGMAEAFALIVRGRYRGLQGDLEGGRGDIEAGRALVRDCGADFYVAGSGLEQGQFHLAAGEPAAAEAVLRETYEMYEQTGGALSATPAAMLARALAEQGRLDEAERFARIAEQRTARDDVFTQIGWRSVLSTVLARRGDLAGAETLARAAVALAEPTDYLEDRAEALFSFGEVLALAGKADEGGAAIEQAIDLFERKGSVLAAKRARARLHDLAREPVAEAE